MRVAENEDMFVGCQCKRPMRVIVDQHSHRHGIRGYRIQHNWHGMARLNTLNVARGIAGNLVRRKMVSTVSGRRMWNQLAC
jgi:hypothetical protein